MEKTIARILSVLFHPLLMPTYGMAILLNLPVYFARMIPFDAKWRLLLLIFVVTFIFPSFLSYLMVRFRVIRSLEMKTREERVFPMISTVIFFFLAYYLLKEINISPIYMYFAMGITFVSVITLILNFFYKVSLHMIGLGSMFGLFLGISFVFYTNLSFWIIIILLVSGLTGFARMKIKSHNSFEIYSGFLAGSIIMLLLFLFI